MIVIFETIDSVVWAVVLNERGEEIARYPGKYQLRAVEPGSRRPMIESHATRDAVDARRVALENAGYNVVVTLADMSVEDEIRKLEDRRTDRGDYRLRDR